MDWNHGIMKPIVALIIFIIFFMIISIILGTESYIIATVIITVIVTTIMGIILYWDDLFSESYYPIDSSNNEASPMILSRSGKSTSRIIEDSLYSIESHDDGRVSIDVVTKYVDRISSIRQNFSNVTSVNVVDDHLVRLTTERSKSILIHLGDKLVKTNLIVDDIYQFKTDGTYIKLSSLGHEAPI